MSSRADQQKHTDDSTRRAVFFFEQLAMNLIIYFKLVDVACVPSSRAGLC